MQYILTVDVGTTAVKGVLVEETGRASLSRSVEIPTICRGEGREQEPSVWWAAFREIVQAALETVRPAEIAAVMMSGQMQDVIPLDAQGEPVRPAILYADSRAEEQARRLEAAVGGETFHRITGNSCDGSLPLPKLMWLLEQEPETAGQIAHVLISSKDYLIARLTGVFCGDVTACSTAGAMDIQAERWDDSLLEAAGVPAAWFPKLYRPGDIVGTVQPDCGCGLCPGTVVLAGIGDAGATTLASGIHRPGEVNLNLGTSGWVAAVSGTVCPSQGVFNLAAAEPHTYLNVAPFLNAGNVHRWIAGLLHGGEADYPSLTALLEESVPGSHGVLCLPYLVGERFPVLDGEMRGCLLGLTPETHPADAARACLEGVSYSLRQGVEQLPERAVSVSLIGGGSRERVWCQILADVLGQNVTVFENGAFLPAQALASLAWKSLGRTVPADAETSTVLYVPDANRTALYDRLYRRFCRVYPTLRALYDQER